MFERLAALTADGVSLELRRFGAEGERRAVLLCTHAMMANGSYFHGRSGGFAAHLARRGIEVYVLDWRGHGASVPPSPRDGIGWSFDDYVEFDLPAVVARVCERSEIEPAELCYLGHSLGGLAGLAGMATGTIALPRKLTLWATSVWHEGPGGSRFRRAAMMLLRATALPRKYAPIKLFRIGTDDEPYRYVEQLAGWCTSGRWSSRTGVDYKALLDQVTCPTLPVTGAGDRLCVPRDAREIVVRLPNSEPMRIVGTAHGDDHDADHFTLFTRPGLSPLWDELADWLVVE